MKVIIVGVCFAKIEVIVNGDDTIMTLKAKIKQDFATSLMFTEFTLHHGSSNGYITLDETITITSSGIRGEITYMASGGPYLCRRHFGKAEGIRGARPPTDNTAHE